MDCKANTARNTANQKQWHDLLSMEPDDGFIDVIIKATKHHEDLFKALDEVGSQELTLRIYKSEVYVTKGTVIGTASNPSVSSVVTSKIF